MLPERARRRVRAAPRRLTAPHTPAPSGADSWIPPAATRAALPGADSWIRPRGRRTCPSDDAETLGCIAVELGTHWHNHRSRRALGAKQDGVLRNHDLWRDGTVRDVVVFSVIDREWPTVRLGLTERLRALDAR